MVVYSKLCLRTVTVGATAALRNLIGRNPNNGTYQIKACCCCDRMFKYGETEFISKKKLKTVAWARPDQNTNTNIKSYYTYHGAHTLKDPIVEDLLLSPRSYYCERTNGSRNEGGFEICQDCNSQRNPLFCIKNYPFGEAPTELTRLNEVERAMVSQGRIDRHIFQLYAGQHKCVSLWHQMHFNDCEHTLGSIERIEEYKIPSIMVCTLSGPFTSDQRALALKRVSIDIQKVKIALHWLISNNVLYKNLKVPEDDDFPVPVIVDHSDLVNGTDTRIETVFETTIIFPQTNEIHENNGGNMTKEEFLGDVMKDKRQHHIVSRSTPNAVKLYDGDNLAKCFPLQFPYGTGVKRDKLDILKYLKYIVDISIPSFQTAEFILPIFNLYAKTKAVRGASIRCKYKISESTNTGDVINKITSDELEERIKNLGDKKRHGDRNTQKLIDSVYAISKKLPFTDEAAAEERRKLFSMCTKFGLPSIFFTVTPDDIDNFRIRVYSNGTGEEAPLSLHDPSDHIDKYLDECAEIRVKYPGYCTQDFDSVLKIVIEHVIGWDLKTDSGKQNAGAFGDCEAWYTPVEEQGRKTLHSHFLIWIKDWSKLLKGLYSIDMEVRSEAALELAEYADHVVSTKCFGLDADKPTHVYTSIGPRFEETATSHHCDKPKMIPCEVQKLRNMRYKYCGNTKKDKSITSCECCKEMFSNSLLVDNVLNSICTKLNIEMSEEQTMKNMRVLLLSENAHLLDNLSAISSSSKEFLLQIIRNMHKERHTFTCFKKNDECRSGVPNRPCDKTKVHFIEEDSILWYDWNGTARSRTPYMLEMERHPLDVFMNQYNPTTSRLLQCNTNVQLGIDGAHIMYCTCYACKSNKKEEKQSMIDACEGLLRTVKKELRDAVESGDTEATQAPNAIAFKRMFVSILSCTKDYVLSAPLAKYLIGNDSRFLCSHEFTNIPFYDFKNGKSSEAKLHVNKTNKAFISSSRDTYLYRPNAMSSTSTSEFYSLYMVKQKSRSKIPCQVEHVFAKEAPSGYKNLRIVERDKPTIPIIYHEMMEDAKSYGGNILCKEFETRFPERVGLAEDCAQKMLILFLPFRCEEELQIDKSYLARLRIAVANNELAGDYETAMQNMQDCRNSLNSGRMEDMVERNTKPLEDEDLKINNKKKKKEHNDKKVKDHLDEKLSELIADISEAFEGVCEEHEQPTSHTQNKHFTMKHIRADGSNQCGIGKSINPKFNNANDDPFLEISTESDGPKKKKERPI
jgi:soluble cytochrome b562